MRLLTCCILLTSYFCVSSQAFLCDGKLYLSQRVDFLDSTNLYEIGLGNPYTISLVGGSGAHYNCIAYNKNDNFIYGLNPETHEFYRIASDANVENLGILTALPTNEFYYAADFSPAGEYIVTTNQFGTQIAVYNINTIPPSLISINSKQYIDGNAGNPHFADIVYDPETTNYYAYDQNLLRLATINPFTGEVTAFGIQQPGVEWIGALYFDPFGNLFGYGAGPGETDATRFFQINKNDGTFTEVSTGPGTTSLDGCSCPYFVDLVKSVTPSMACPGDTVTFDFQIANASGESLNAIRFVDELPPGFEFADSPSNLLGGNVAAGTGLGFNSLEVTDINLPPGISSFSVKVKVDGDFNGASSLLNQARIENLPIFLPSPVLSDNFHTLVQNDPTELIVLAQPNLSGLNIPVNHCTNEELMLSSNVQGQVSWVGPNGFSSNESNPVIQDLTLANAGLYTLSVIGENGCTNDTSLAINILPLPSINVLGDSLYCSGNRIELQAVGESEPLDFLWTGPNGFESTEQNIVLESANQEVSGEYLVMVTAPNGCSSNDSKVIVVETIDLTSNGPICTGENLILEAPDGISFSWTGPLGFSSPVQNPILQNTTVDMAGAYQLVLEKPNGQSCLEEIVIDILPLPTIDIQDNAPLCFGSTLNLSIEQNVQVQWILPNGEEVTGSAFTIEDVKESDEGKYLASATDDNACVSVDSTMITIYPSFEIVASGDTTIDSDGQAELRVVVDGTSAPYHFSWSPPGTLSAPDAPISFTDTDFNTTFVIDVMDINGCTKTDSLSVMVRRKNEIFFPNIFSPNDDGINDLFFINGNESLIEVIETFQIFDRWGELVFENSNFLPNQPASGWNGRLNNIPLNPAVFAYLAIVKFHGGDRIIYKGDVTLIR